MSELHVPPRSQVPHEHTWDLESVFATPADWEQAAAAVEARLGSLARFHGRLAESPEVLLEWFEAWQALALEAGRVLVYANMRRNVDLTDPSGAALQDRARSLAARLGAATAFAEPELLRAGVERLQGWLSDPRLAPYAHYLERLARRSPHVRSAEVEELLELASDPFRAAASIHSTLADADLVFTPAHRSGGHEPIPVTQGSINTLLADPDRTLRRTAWESYTGAHRAVRHAAAACLAAGVKQNVFRARARGYASALEAALAPEAIPPSVFHNTLECFRANLPVWHRAWEVRRRALGLERLQAFDLRGALAPERPRVPFEQAMAWIEQALAPLGTEYVAAVRRGAVEQRWIDRAVNQGKRGGAYSNGRPGTHPFILMSYADSLLSMSTLAHELGHSMHSFLAWQAQPVIYSDYSTLAAEVASNLHQALLRQHLRTAAPEPAFQLALVEEFMAYAFRYLLVMPTLARLEHELHARVEAGQAFTADDLSQRTHELLAEACGPAVELDPERDGILWATFPVHLYLNYYTFQYTTGVAGAQALAEALQAGQPDAAARYLAFLRAGASRFPLEALRQAGVDLESPQPVEAAFAALDATTDRLEALLARRGAGAA